MDRKVLKVGIVWDQCFDASVINDQKETKDDKLFRFVEDTKCTESSLGLESNMLRREEMRQNQV